MHGHTRVVPGKYGWRGLKILNIRSASNPRKAMNTDSCLHREMCGGRSACSFIVPGVGFSIEGANLGIVTEPWLRKPWLNEVGHH